MNSFISKVQRRKVKNPLQVGFDLNEWKNSFYECESLDKSDIALALAGTMFSRKLTRFWQRFEELNLRSFDSRDLRRKLVAVCNRNLAIMNHEIEPALQKRASTQSSMFDILNYKIELPFDENLYSPDDLLTSGIDGIQGPLKFTFDKGRPIGAKADLETSRRLAMLGQVHSMIINVWEDCLWNGYSFGAHTDGFAVTPPTTEHQEAQASGLARMMALQVEMTLHGRRIWASMPENLRDHFASQRVSLHTSGTGDGFRYILSPAPTNPAKPIRSFTARVIASELYLLELLDEPIPKLSAITPNILLSAWEVFHELGSSLKRRLPRNGGVTTPDELLKFTPIIPRAKLVKLLMEAIGLAYADANRIVRFMTFSQNQSDDVWARPFVEIDDQMVAPLLVCLCDPNPLRMLERWMKHGGVNLQTRGPSFEAHARNQLAKSIHDSKKLTGAGVLPYSFNFQRDTNDAGDIDVVIWFGSTILLAEVKCNLFPTAPKELNNYFSDLEHAASQILRKKAAFERGVAEFWITHVKQAEPEKSTIIPLIISNLPIGTGYSFNGVPVADLLILERFLEEGEVALLGRYSDNEPTTPAHLVTLYNTQNEAEQVIAEYLQAPPQVRLYKTGLKPRVTRIPTLTADDHRWLVCDMDTDISTETVRQTLPPGVVDSLLGPSSALPTSDLPEE